jgi:hypothetical protein
VNELQFVMHCAINEKMKIHKASSHSQGTSKEARGMTETGHIDLRKKVMGIKASQTPSAEPVHIVQSTRPRADKLTMRHEDASTRSLRPASGF